MEIQSDMKSVIATVQEHAKPTTIEIPKIAPETGRLVVHPEGMTVTDVSAMVKPRLERPERRKGTAVFTQVASLIEHANRFKDEHSSIFADDEPSKPSISVVLDYHEMSAAGAPRFGEHRGHYAFPISEEWAFWQKVSGSGLDIRQFAELLEDRITDVVDPGGVGPATKELAEELGITLAGRGTLKTLAKGLNIRVDRKVVSAMNADTGEGALVFEETHNDKDGAPLKVPNGFVIAIPVFRGGATYSIPVRLRYRIGSGGVTWILQLHRADVAFRDAFGEACELVRAETELPLLFGRPE